MGDFLRFRKFISPFLIKLGFWISLIFVFVLSLEIMEDHGVPLGLLALFIGIICARITCESLLLLFNVHDALQAIRKNQEKALSSIPNQGTATLSLGRPKTRPPRSNPNVENPQDNK